VGCDTLEKKSPTAMKKFALIFLLLQITAGSFSQTVFTRVETGAVVSTPSDSRSVNIADLNNDGFDDLIITNGPGGGGAPDFMYFGNQEGGFDAVSNLFTSQSWSSVGAAVADANNDGLSDIFAVRWYGQSNALYTQESVGEFAQTNMQAGSYSEAASWGDYNADGLPDLYVSNSFSNLKNGLFLNVTDTQLPGAPVVLEQVLTGDPATDEEPSRGVTWIDYNNDGKIDLFVCNEENTANALYRNDGDGLFSRVQNAGDLFAVTRSSMSASWADVNNDGWSDVFIANSGFFQPQNNQLFINNGDGTFLAQQGPWDEDGGCSFSSSYADYDNDGDLDLAVTNGYCSGEIFNFLYINDGDGNFTADEMSVNDLSTPCSYGLAWGDFDNNGFADLAIATCRNTPESPLPVNILWLNEGNGNNWIKINLSGTVSNQDGIGAKLHLKATIDGEPVWQMRDITTQSGYCSQNSLTAQFGLGDATQADSLFIEWPSGIHQYFTEVDALQILNITEPAQGQSDLLEIPFAERPAIDGVEDMNEWAGGVEVGIEITPSAIIRVRAMHHQDTLYVSYTDNLESINFRFPEMVIDPQNLKGINWAPDQWWFHVSGADCENMGAPSVYDNCLTLQPDWQAVPNFSPGPPSTDFVEMAFPFSKLGIEVIDTIGISFIATNTGNAWNYWPENASLTNPSTWATAIFGSGPTNTGDVVKNHFSAGVHPNPGSDTFYLSTDGIEQILQIEIISLDGKMLHQYKFRMEAGRQVYPLQTDAAFLKPGAYLVKVESLEAVSVIKLVVQ
jgi:hypothetical protein